MVHPLIRQRRSTVLFDDTRKIPGQDLLKLFEAARWAPSSRNAQPWHFILAERGDPFHGHLLACLDETNQEWASKASVLLVTVAQVISDYKNRKNRYAWHDTGMAYANPVFQAISLGMVLHPMGGFDREKAIRDLEIPEGYEPVIFAAIGYKSDGKGFAKHLLDREKGIRSRRTLERFVFHGKFRGSYPFSQ